MAQLLMDSMPEPMIMLMFCLMRLSLHINCTIFHCSLFIFRFLFDFAFDFLALFAIQKLDEERSRGSRQRSHAFAMLDLLSTLPPATSLPFGSVHCATREAKAKAKEEAWHGMARPRSLLCL